MRVLLRSAVIVVALLVLRCQTSTVQAVPDLGTSTTSAAAESTSTSTTTTTTTTTLPTTTTTTLSITTTTTTTTTTPATTTSTTTTEAPAEEGEPDPVYYDEVTTEPATSVFVVNSSGADDASTAADKNATSGDKIQSRGNNVPQDGDGAEVIGGGGASTGDGWSKFGIVVGAIMAVGCVAALAYVVIKHRGRRNDTSMVTVSGTPRVEGDVEMETIAITSPSNQTPLLEGDENTQANLSPDKSRV